jgi:thiosulfate dehydrogenase
MRARAVEAGCLVVVVALAACEGRSERADGGAVAQGGARVVAHTSHFDPSAWHPPAETDIPGDSLGASIRRGLALITHTTDSLPAYAPGRINCSNCHLNAGRNPEAAPLAGSFARFPKYMDRTGAVIGLADRVNYCFTRSLAGNRLPVESREMQDILAYLAWLSTGVPIGEGKKLPGADGILAMQRQLTGDRTRGATVFTAKCAVCHGADGQGNPAIPPGVPALWGARSFSVGASMARRGKAASFIWHNMPFGAGKSLTPQEAFDVAAYVTSQTRVDSPGKEGDWPAGGTPSDVPYATTGHAAFEPPPLLRRSRAREAVVPRPASAGRKAQ